MLVCVCEQNMSSLICSSEQMFKLLKAASMSRITLLKLIKCYCDIHSFCFLIGKTGTLIKTNLFLSPQLFYRSNSRDVEIDDNGEFKQRVFFSMQVKREVTQIMEVYQLLTHAQVQVQFLLDG